MSKEGKKRSFDDGDAPSSKRFKQTVDKAVVDEFTCPITNELPLDPVMGEDGRCYERTAIEEYFRHGRNRRSPITNEPIGRKLIPALQVRNMLERFVKDGLIRGEKADQWKKRIEDEQCVAIIRRRAESGNAEAMDMLGAMYNTGGFGIKQNYTEAFKWYEQASNAGHFTAMTSLAFMHIMGSGTKKNVSEGMLLLGIAAQGGSSTAAYYVGRSYAEGLHGLTKNAKRARLWLEIVKDEGEVGGRIWNERKNLLASLDEP